MRKRQRVRISALVLTALVTLVVGVKEPAQADEPAKATVEETYPGLATGILKSARLTALEKGHVGFYAEADVLKQLEKMGVK